MCSLSKYYVLQNSGCRARVMSLIQSSGGNVTELATAEIR